MHNTIMMNSEEINSIDDAQYFSFFSNSFSRILDHKITPDYNEVVCVRGDNFETKAKSYHYRSFKYTKEHRLIIYDKVVCSGEFIASSYLHFHPSLMPELVYEKDNYLIKGIKDVEIKIIDKNNFIENINISPSLYSKGYGYIENSNKLKIDIKGFNEAKIKMFFTIRK
jgi:hypothetical protein